MSTLKVRIENLKFVSYNGADVETLEEKYLKGNGWECRIDDKGNLFCIAEELYRCCNLQRLELSIKNGEFKLVRTVNSGRPKVLKSYKLKWPQDGVIGLQGGLIYKRRAYFREKSFQNFLDEYSLFSVREEAPNRSYSINEELFTNGDKFYEKIETDGKITVVSENMTDKGTSYLINKIVTVSDAEWVIKTTVKKEKLKNRVLYTDQNLKHLKGLNKF